MTNQKQKPTEGKPTIQYFAVADNAEGEIELLLVKRGNGHKSQRWLGQTFNSTAEAMEFVADRNLKLFRTGGHRRLAR